MRDPTVDSPSKIATKQEIDIPVAGKRVELNAPVVELIERVRVEQAIKLAHVMLGLYGDDLLRKRRTARDEALCLFAGIILSPHGQQHEDVAHLTNPTSKKDVGLICRILGEPPIGRPTYAERDRLIVGVIDEIRKRGFAPTRNDATRSGRESACSIVAKALAELGLNLSERTVEDFWTESARPGNPYQ